MSQQPTKFLLGILAPEPLQMQPQDEAGSLSAPNTQSLIFRSSIVTWNSFLTLDLFWTTSYSNTSLWLQTFHRENRETSRWRDLGTVFDDESEGEAFTSSRGRDEESTNPVKTSKKAAFMELFWYWNTERRGTRTKLQPPMDGHASDP